jgi:HSP20 family molecular chaperone IbpA
MGVMATIGPTSGSRPRPLVHEDAKEYVVDVDVSDFALAELMVETVGSHVSVRGTRPGGERDGFEESFGLPDEVEPIDVKAVYRRGTLELHARRSRPRHRRVPIEREWLVNPSPKGC